MLQPRLKTVYPAIQLDADTVNLGMPRTPRSATLSDPSGRLREVLALLDGTRTVPEVIDATQADATDVHRLVDALAGAGYLEDAAAPVTTELTAREVRRYSRNAEFFSFFTGGPDGPAHRYAPQLSLARARVTVLGVGGLGSHVALHLAALGIGRLRLVDHDDVEESNLNRQLLFTDQDVGRPKVVAAAGRLTQVNPLVDVEAVEGLVDGPGDAASVLADTDLLICAADRPRVDLDRWLNAGSLDAGRPWMRGASVGLSAALDLFVPGRTACAECRLQPADGSDADLHLLDRIRELGDVTVSPCVSPVAGVLGSLAALEALKFLTGIAPTPLLDHQLVIDVPNAELHHLPDPRRPDCRACSDPVGRTEEAPRVDAVAARA